LKSHATHIAMIAAASKFEHRKSIASSSCNIETPSDGAHRTQSNWDALRQHSCKTGQTSYKQVDKAAAHLSLMRMAHNLALQIRVHPYQILRRCVSAAAQLFSNIIDDEKERALAQEATSCHCVPVDNRRLLTRHLCSFRLTLLRPLHNRHAVTA
jgi:hypothetical protein